MKRRTGYVLHRALVLKVLNSPLVTNHMKKVQCHVHANQWRSTSIKQHLQFSLLCLVTNILHVKNMPDTL